MRWLAALRFATLLLGALLLALGACSVPDVTLEGKSCPCATELGYVCDKPTNRCFHSNGDGGIVDSRSTTSCLGSSGSELYRYTGMFDWIHADPSWTGAAEIQQTSPQAQDSYAYKTSSTFSTAHDYHITATMRQISQGNGTPEMGIVLRAQLSTQDKSRYTCTWSFKSKTLTLSSVTAGSTTSLMTKTVNEASTAIPLTMEAKVVGASLSCCIREYPTAVITGVTNADTAAGYPGLETNRMSAGFGSFAVEAP